MEVSNNINIQESVQIVSDYLKGNSIADEWSSSISMVPGIHRDMNPDYYNPRMISIGPLHHEDTNLRASEGLKRTYVRTLLHYFDSPLEETLEACLSDIMKSIQKIKACYVGMWPYSDPELARMMVIDASFILGFCYSELKLNNLVMMSICLDLLLVENQIPFFVLGIIFEHTIFKYRQTSLHTVIYPLLEVGNRSLFRRDLTIPNILAHATNHDHLLGLLHKCYKPSFSISSGFSKIYNAMELEKAGVSFEPNEDVSWPMAIKIEYSRFRGFPWFWAKPIIQMPVIEIGDTTELFLRNMIAYELTSQVDEYFASLACAIDDLVDTGLDVAMLVESKVIINNLGSNKEAANVINKLCKNVFLDNFYSEQWDEVRTYYNKSWPRYIARLRRTYFNNPWNIIALLAGLILFSLTTIQTYFTVNPRK